MAYPSMAYPVHGAAPDSMEGGGHAPNYVYTEEGIFLLRDDLVVLDLCQPIYIPYANWKDLFDKQTCFSETS